MITRILTLLFTGTALSGCVAVTVVDTAVGVAATAVETTVDVTAGVVGGAVDLVTEDDENEE